jgi:phage shock protein PspC (stress-responsive transcriptional regulator)
VVGVCAAIGNATNTDPVVWRVLIAILAFFGGIGLLIYVLGWLVIPQDGDQASPLEALFGRGRSSTSPIVTVLLCILAGGLVFASLRGSFWSPVLLAAVAVGVAVLLSRRGGRVGAAGAGGGAPASERPPGAGGQAPAGGWTVPPTGASNPAYRAPFAPHGPYGQQQPYPPAGAAYQDTREYPLAGREPDPWSAPVGSALPPPPPPPPPPAMGRPKPPRQRKPRSPLGRYTFFALCLALGGLAVLAVTGLAVPPSGYVALGLGVVGAGLLIGAFMGRARGLIALGIILAIAMPPALIGETVRWDHVRSDIARNRNFDNQTWQPTSFDEVQPTYRSDVGNATLDLSQVDFTGQHGDVTVSAGAGNVDVLLPSAVDTTVTVQNGMGNVDLFGERQSKGMSEESDGVTNLGPDGTGGGDLNLTIHAGMGNVEVSRS